MEIKRTSITKIKNHIRTYLKKEGFQTKGYRVEYRWIAKEDYSDKSNDNGWDGNLYDLNYLAKFIQRDGQGYWDVHITDRWGQAGASGGDYCFNDYRFLDIKEVA